MRIEPPLEGLDKLLVMWADFMGHGGSVSRGFPSKSMGFIGSGKNSSEDFAEESDHYIGITMDTIINDLPERLRSAINHCYLGSHYSYSAIKYIDVLDEALTIIEEQARKKGLM